MIENRQEFNAAHDSLSQLLLENFNDSQRVALLKKNFELVQAQFEQLASPEAVARINDTCDITFVFNYHGDATDAARTVNKIWDPAQSSPAAKPFLTFVEGVNNQDLHESSQFSFTINTAFGAEFSNMPASMPEGLTPELMGEWGYWRDRGLIERGSIIVPVDLRHYSAQLVETLIGQRFDPSFLTRSHTTAEMQAMPFDEVFIKTKQYGLMVMYSNGLREYAASSQIISVLSRALGEEHAQLRLTEEQRKKLHALRQERLHKDGKLPIYVVYGSAHHGMTHILSKHGIPVHRKFATQPDELVGMKNAGTAMDEFFEGHVFDLKPIDVDKYTRHLVLEQLLMAPLRERTRFGVVHEAKSIIDVMHAYFKIAKLSRDPILNENIEQCYSEFVNRPAWAVEQLRKIGIPLRNI